MSKATMIYRKHHNDNRIDTVSLYDGVKEMLFQLHRNGTSLAIASSKGKKVLFKILENEGLHDIVSFVGGKEDV